jgi:predicted RND superfamily exporter protein/outer membrane lipoprotein-sorting protein
MAHIQSFIIQFESQIGNWIIKHRWWIISITILLVIIAASGARFLSFNKDSRVFFSDKNPQLQALETLEKTYNKLSDVLFVIEPQDGNVFTRETLTAVEELTKDSWLIPYSNRVNSLTNFQDIKADGDEVIVRDLVIDASSLSKDGLNQIKETALSDPLLVNSIISPSGHVTGVSVNILLPGESMEEVTEIASFSRQLAQEFNKKYTNIDIHLTGTVMVDNAFGEVSQRDLSTLVPLMFVILVIIVGFALRNVIGVISTFMIISLSTATGVGLAGWMSLEITSASVNAPLIILTLAVADSVHILTTVFQQMRNGKAKNEAITESLRINFQPVFLTSVTTVIGFLTLNFSDAPPFRDLGNIVSMGVLSAFVFSITFLPAFLVVIPIHIKPRIISAESVFNRLSEWVIRWRKSIFRGALISITILSIGLVQVEFNDDFIKYFSPKMNIRQTTDFAEANLRGGDVIEYSLESGIPGGITNPYYLAIVDSFSNWYLTQPKVLHVSSITTTIKRLNKSMHGDDNEFYLIPSQVDLIAQYLLLYEMSLPFGLDLNNQINVDKSATRMIVSLRDTNTSDLREMDSNARAWLSTNAPESMFTYGSGLSIIWAHISQRNIDSMITASLGALILISVLLMFTLRSYKHGVLSLVPNLMPSLMAFGVWGFFVGQVGLGLSIVVAMTLGIVVDDTVHFLSKYLRARREHKMNSPNAVRYAFNTVGMAMWITTLALVAGFIILSLSGYRMNSDMGMMSGLTLILALGLDLLLLPALLLKIDSKSDKSLSSKNKKTMKKLILAPVRLNLRKLGLFLILLFVVMPYLAIAQTSEKKGMDIVIEQNLRNEGFKDHTTSMQMVLRNKNGNESIRQLRVNTLEVMEDGDKMMIIFDSPRDVKGTGFLTYTHKVGDDDQWLYLPALKRVKRISSQNKSGSFMASEFSYEDFSSQEIEKFTYKWIKDDNYEDQDYYVVERYPVDKNNSGYTRQVMWIDKSEYRTWKIEFYDRKNSLQKTLTTNGFVEYQDKYWRANEMIMVNHQNGKSTLLRFSDYRFATGLTEADFNTNSLARVK